MGYPGPTPTGAEPLAIATAASYPYLENKWPLVGAEPLDGAPDNFTIFNTWGNLAPWYSVNSSYYGLPKASPLLPKDLGCSITQVHYLYRHGAR